MNCYHCKIPGENNGTEIPQAEEEEKVNSLNLKKSLLTVLIVSNTLTFFPVFSQSTYWKQENIAGLSFARPAGWRESLRKEATYENASEPILKFTGTGACVGELALSAGKSDLSPNLLLQTINETILSKLPDYRVGSLKSLPVAGQYNGSQLEVNFTQAKTPYTLRYLVFKIRDLTYTLALTTPLSSYQTTGSIWQTALNTLRAAATPAKTQSNTTASAKEKAGDENPLTYWQSENFGLGYPQYLKDEHIGEHDHIFKASSSSNNGFLALDIYKAELHPHLSLQETTNIIEEKFFASQNNYRKVKEENTHIGTSNNGRLGIEKEFTYTANGRDIHQLTGFVPSGNHIYAICLATSGLSPNQANQIWSKIKASVTVKH
jgi:hypothetical protein